MLKPITIVPTAYVRLIANDKMHMALAHLIDKDLEYTNFYRTMSRLGNYVILDNSLIEKAQTGISTLVKRAKSINASEIILPDVYTDCDATLQATTEAQDYLENNHLEQDFKTMIVPQGKNMEEWLQCLELLANSKFDTIGIPKVLTHLCGRDARLDILMTLQSEYKTLIENKEIHLLGCWETPLECTLIAKAEQQKIIPKVRSIDSGIAYVYARDNLLICNAPRPSGAIDFSARDAEESILRSNINMWKQSADVTPHKVIKLIK